MRAPDCTVGRRPYGDRDCQGPGTYYCDEMLWGSECRRWQQRNGGYTGDGEREVAEPTPAEKLAQSIHEAGIEAGAVDNNWRRLRVRESRVKIETAQKLLDDGTVVLP